MPNSTALRASEAIPLGYALTAYIAEQNGIRIMAIKGMAHEFHEIRLPRVPSDVDILVEPSAHAMMVELLIRRGWQERGEITEAHGFAGHSVTMFHPEWPIHLDVHRRFPGFLADPSVTFDALWKPRVETVIGGRPVYITDKAGSILILALHSLRSSAFVRPRADLASMIDSAANFSQEDRGKLAALAEATMSTQTLSEVLPQLGVPVSPVDPHDVSPQVREWRRLVDGKFAPATVWISHVMETPWPGRPRVLFRALWPSTHDLRVAHPQTPPGKYHELRARWGRLLRGAKAVPQALMTRWRS